MVRYSQANDELRQAREAYEAGRPREALARLDFLLGRDPASGPGNQLAGLCLAAVGQWPAAEIAFRRSLASDKRSPIVHAQLGELLQRQGRADEAEKTYRAGLAVDRRDPHCAAGLANLLAGLGRLREALQVTTPLAAAQSASPQILDMHAETLVALKRHEEALAFRRRAAEAGSAFAPVRMAASLCELGRFDEAEAAMRTMSPRLHDHPAVLSMWGAIYQESGRLDLAEHTYRRVLDAAPFDADTHRAVANLVWLRSASVETAAEALDRALAQGGSPALVAIKAKLYERAGRHQDSFDFVSAQRARWPEDPLIHAVLATAAVRAGDPGAAVGHARRADGLAKGEPSVRLVLAETLLAAGQAEEAAAIADALAERQPYDQSVLALQATAWRILGDGRAAELADYDAMIGVFTLPTPPGWPTLDAFLGDLAAALERMHGAEADPLEQTLRLGTQTRRNLLLSDEPAVRAFFKAVDAPVRQYLSGLGKGADPLRARNTGRYRLAGAWSVHLDPGGFHVDHIHPGGWISSAFYVRVPAAASGEGREGWLKFGEPALPTGRALGPERHVQPEPGRLVLFPSYLWHGTVPFSGGDRRLTVAFDLTPD